MFNAGLLLFIYVVWGTTYAAISMALQGYSPFSMAVIRYTLCGLAFLPFTRREDWKLEKAKYHMMGGILLTLGNALVVWSQQKMPSGLAALFLGTIPLFLMILNWIAFEKKRPTNQSFMGLIIGLIGVTYLSYATGKDMTLRASCLMLLLAAFIWAIGTLLLKHSPAKYSMNSSLAIQLLTGGLFLNIPAFINGEDLLLNLTQTSFTPLMGMVYLIVFGTMLAMAAYNRLLKVYPSQIVGTYALMNPIFAIILGQMILGEKMTMEIITSTVLVLSGVAVILFSKKTAKVKEPCIQTT